MVDSGQETHFGRSHRIVLREKELQLEYARCACIAGLDAVHSTWQLMGQKELCWSLLVSMGICGDAQLGRGPQEGSHTFIRRRLWPSDKHIEVAQIILEGCRADANSCT